MNIKKRGFTLAEVLITLGIIGVIAALTLPMLLAETKKIETSARLKKFVSTFQQAIMQSELVNGKASEWTQFRCSSGNNAICTNEEEEARGKAPEQFFNTYLKVCEDYDISLRFALFYNIGYLDRKLIIKRAVEENSLSASIKHIEYIRYNILKNFYDIYKEKLSEEQSNAVLKEIDRKSQIIKPSYR